MHVCENGLLIHIFLQSSSPPLSLVNCYILTEDELHQLTTSPLCLWCACVLILGVLSGTGQPFIKHNLLTQRSSLNTSTILTCMQVEHVTQTIEGTAYRNIALQCISGQKLHLLPF